MADAHNNLTRSRDKGIVARASGEKYPWAHTALEQTGFQRGEAGEYHLPGSESDTSRATVAGLIQRAERHRVTVSVSTRHYIGDVAGDIARLLPGQWNAQVEIYSHPLWQEDLVPGRDDAPEGNPDVSGSSAVMAAAGEGLTSQNLADQCGIRAPFARPSTGRSRARWAAYGWSAPMPGRWVAAGLLLGVNGALIIYSWGGSGPGSIKEAVAGDRDEHGTYPLTVTTRSNRYPNLPRLQPPNLPPRSDIGWYSSTARWRPRSTPHVTATDWDQPPRVAAAARARRNQQAVEAYATHLAPHADDLLAAAHRALEELPPARHTIAWRNLLKSFSCRLPRRDRPLSRQAGCPRLGRRARAAHGRVAAPRHLGARWLHRRRPRRPASPTRTRSDQRGRADVDGAGPGSAAAR